MLLLKSLEGPSHVGMLTLDQFQITGQLMIIIRQPGDLLVQLCDVCCVFRHGVLHVLELLAHEVEVS